MKSTYAFDESKLHGSFFAFDTDLKNSDITPSANVSDQLLYVSNERQLKTVPYKNSGENTWWNRAIIVYFKLHCQLGRNSLNLTSNVFGIKRSTISTWLTNRDYIAIWLKLLTDLTFAQVINSIPKDSPYLHKYKNMKEKSYYKNAFFRSLHVFEKKVSSIQSKLFSHKIDASPQRLSCVAKKSSCVDFTSRKIN